MTLSLLRVRPWRSDAIQETEASGDQELFPQCKDEGVGWLCTSSSEKGPVAARVRPQAPRHFIEEAQSARLRRPPHL